MGELAPDPIRTVTMDGVRISMILGTEEFSLAVDVTVHTPAGEVFHCTFFTPDQVQAIMRAHEVSGETLSGTYFWAANPIVVNRLDEGTIVAVVLDLWREGQLPHAMLQSFPEAAAGDEDVEVPGDDDVPGGTSVARAT